MPTTLRRRRTIRVFTPEPIARPIVQELARAVLTSPTSMGRKSPEVVVVNDIPTIRRLQDCKQHSATPLATATLALAVIADTTKTDVWVEDASIAAFAVQLVAEAHNLGSTWIQLRSRQSVEGENSEKAVRRILNIPDHYGVLCLLAVGHKGEEKAPYSDEELDWSRVHTEKFQA